MSEILELLDNFNFEADTSKAVFDLFSRVLSTQATIASLRELIFQHLSNSTGIEHTEIVEQYNDIYTGNMNELLSEFVSRYGVMQSSGNSGIS